MQILVHSVHSSQQNGYRYLEVQHISSTTQLSMLSFHRVPYNNLTLVKYIYKLHQVQQLTCEMNEMALLSGNNQQNTFYNFRI